MSDDVYYIRTGDKISKPFRIGLLTKILSFSFILYMSWVTYEFFRIQWLEEQIEKLKESTEAKYLVIAQYDDAIRALETLSINHKYVADLFEPYETSEDGNAKPN